MGRRKKNSTTRMVEPCAARRSKASMANRPKKRSFFARTALRRTRQFAATASLSLFRFVRSSLLRLQVKRQEKFLVVRDTTSLGEKRFVAVIEVGSERYLIGGSANSVALLASLRDQPAPPDHFSAVLRDSTKRSVAIQ